MPLILAMSTALPELCSETLPELGVEAVAALERGDRGLEAGLGQVLERGEHAPVDLAGPDVVAAAGVELDALVGEHPALEQPLGPEQDLPDRGRAALAAVEHVASRGAVDGGGLEQLPAVEDRLRIDQRGTAAGRADREVETSGAAGVGPAHAAEHGAADHVRALAKAVQAHLGRVEPERPREVGVEGLESVLLAELRLRHLLEAAGVAGARVVRVGEEALLYRQRGHRAGARGGVAVAGGGIGLAARGGRRGGRRVLHVVVRAHDARGAALVRRVGPRHGVEARRRSRGASTCSGCRTRPAGPRSGPASGSRPIFLITPSFTATTGAPRRVKMPMLRRPSLDSTRLAAFSPVFARLRRSRSAMSSA